jgi:hypothetical protein
MVMTKQKSPALAAVGRDGMGRIILDAAVIEQRVALRLVLTPAEAARLADELSEHAQDDAHNLAAYAFTLADEEREELLANAEPLSLVPHDGGGR